MFKSLIGSCTGLLANILNYSKFLNVSSTMIIKSNFDQSTAENFIAFFLDVYQQVANCWQFLNPLHVTGQEATGAVTVGSFASSVGVLVIWR